MPATKLVHKCSICHKSAELLRETSAGKSKFYKLSCGHTVGKLLEKPADEKLRELTSSLGHKLFPFQVTAAEFCRKADFNALLNLDPGTGKTVVEAALLAVHENLLPVLIVCKSALRTHHLKTNYYWNGTRAQVVSEREELPLLDIFPVVIISFDMLWRCDWSEEVFKQFKLLIIDETQNIKNPGAKRTAACRKAARHIPHRIGLSATPIKNHAGEYFTILNILRPDMFPSQRNYEYRYVDQYWDGYRFKYGGLRNEEYFYNITKEFIIRMKRSDVLPDLPEINRQFLYCDLGEQVKKAYAKLLEEFADEYDKGGFNGAGWYTSIIAYFSRMRHLTGLSKVQACIARLEEHILNNPGEKIVVFTHHNDVMNLLHAAMKARSKGEDGEELFAEPTLMGSTELQKEGQNLVDSFLKSNSPIAIVSTLSGGEGLNFQPVSNVIMLERQWNPANEEQAESRFPRPGATADVIDVIYITAIGTIDEYFAELVERKRAILSQTIDKEKVNWEETSLIKELAALLAAKGRTKWSY